MAITKMHICSRHVSWNGWKWLCLLAGWQVWPGNQLAASHVYVGEVGKLITGLRSLVSKNYRKICVWVCISAEHEIMSGKLRFWAVLQNHYTIIFNHPHSNSHIIRSLFYSILFYLNQKRHVSILSLCLFHWRGWGARIVCPAVMNPAVGACVFLIFGRLNRPLVYRH